MFDPDKQLEQFQKDVAKAIKNKDVSMASALKCDVEQLMNDYESFASSYEMLLDDIEDEFGDYLK